VVNEKHNLLECDSMQSEIFRLLETKYRFCLQGRRVSQIGLSACFLLVTCLA
jgi:hypothetical protein